MGHGFKIFLACDDFVFCQTLRQHFENHPNFEICGEETDPLKAVREAIHAAPDLVIVELNEVKKDEIDSLDVAETIKTIEPTLPVFLILAHYDLDVERYAVRQGIDAIFEKGTDLTALSINAQAVCGVR